MSNWPAMSGRARLSSARRAGLWGVRRRAEDRRALPITQMSEFEQWNFTN